MKLKAGFALRISFWNAVIRSPHEGTVLFGIETVNEGFDICPAMVVLLQRIHLDAVVAGGGLENPLRFRRVGYDILAIIVLLQDEEFPGVDGGRDVDGSHLGILGILGRNDDRLAFFGRCIEPEGGKYFSVLVFGSNGHEVGVLLRAEINLALAQLLKLLRLTGVNILGYLKIGRLSVRLFAGDHRSDGRRNSENEKNFLHNRDSSITLQVSDFRRIKQKSTLIVRGLLRPDRAEGASAP